MDKNYWQDYYAKHLKSSAPSLFAEFVWDEHLCKMCESSADSSILTQSNNHKSLIELGCGNGRDSIFFANNGIKTLGIDQCENVIDFLNKHYGSENLAFQSGDFTALDSFKDKFDCIYSRFTLHSINATQQENLFSWIRANLAPNGILAIETRGFKNALFGKGVAVANEANAFIFDNHYRRFVALDALCEAIESLDLHITLAKEEAGFAPYGDENDIFIRIIARATERERERERERVARHAVIFVFLCYESLVLSRQNAHKHAKIFIKLARNPYTITSRKICHNAQMERVA